MFKVGDKVKFKKSSLDSGMIDATEDAVFEVAKVAGPHIQLKDVIYILTDWWNKEHFEYVEEETMTEEKYIPKVGDKVKGFEFDVDDYPHQGWAGEMDDLIGVEGNVSNVGADTFLITFPYGGSWTYPMELAHMAKIDSVEEPSEDDSPIPWQVGQEVWCLIFGKGVVSSVDLGDSDYPVGVNIQGKVLWYTIGGKYYSDRHRALFFSEPQIIAEKLPPKKPFVPEFEKGDVIIVFHKKGSYKNVLTVRREDEHVIWFDGEGSNYKKSEWNFYKLGEEIKFS